jgi:hypothetical protein
MRGLRSSAHLARAAIARRESPALAWRVTNQGAVHVPSRSAFIALLVAGGLVAAAPAARADDPIKDIIDHEVPALKDGTKLAPADVEKALLAALARRNFDATVMAPGLITAKFSHGKHLIEVSLPYSDSAYSVRYLDSKYMDYNEKKQRIDDAYNEWIDGLDEHIEAQLEIALKRLKVSQKEAKKAAKVAAS